MKRAPLLASSVAAACLLVAPSAARAQLHVDGSAQVGVMQRFLRGGPAGEPGAHLGPAAQLTAHVALFPLVRVGAYVGHDISPMGGSRSARDLTWAGVRAKVMAPWPRGATRAYLFTGFGYDGVYARSSREGGVLRDGAGGFFEVPLGLGVNYTFYKPFALLAEVGGKVGFGEHGSAYEGAGADRFALGLTVGLMIDL
ncbi:MAG: hypothetical protein JWP97_2907 [Labilithrix sp.]|nr:hypothetical protein [Labilithrix sp.]